MDRSTDPLKSRKTPTMPFNRADFYDAELRRHSEHLRLAARIGPSDRVLDVGCGAGQSARDAARIARDGSVLGVDISDAQLEVARQRSAEEGLRNVTFELGDAQTMAFRATDFDICISRFGVMFFSDPVAAFTNIGGAIRPGGRLALLVWQTREANEWATVIPSALPRRVELSTTSATFSLADPQLTTGLLAAAGFAAIRFTDVHEPVCYGQNVDEAYEAVANLFMGQSALTTAYPDDTHQRVRAILEEHVTPAGVLFDSQAWLVTAEKF